MVEKMLFKTAKVAKLEEVLNKKLYEAAAKAGMVKELAKFEFEVYVQEWNGKLTAHVAWEKELAADDDAFDWAAVTKLEKRCEAFVAKLAPKVLA